MVDSGTKIVRDAVVEGRYAFALSHTHVTVCRWFLPC